MGTKNCKACKCGATPVIARTNKGQWRVKPTVKKVAKKATTGTIRAIVGKPTVKKASKKPVAVKEKGKVKKSK